jgi:hypothetical protein
MDRYLKFRISNAYPLHFSRGCMCVMITQERRESCRKIYVKCLIYYFLLLDQCSAQLNFL